MLEVDVGGSAALQRLRALTETNQSPQGRTSYLRYNDYRSFVATLQLETRSVDRCTRSTFQRRQSRAWLDLDHNRCNSPCLWYLQKNRAGIEGNLSHCCLAWPNLCGISSTQSCRCRMLLGRPGTFCMLWSHSQWHSGLLCKGCTRSFPPHD